MEALTSTEAINPHGDWPCGLTIPIIRPFPVWLQLEESHEDVSHLVVNDAHGLSGLETEGFTAHKVFVLQGRQPEFVILAFCFEQRSPGTRGQAGSSELSQIQRPDEPQDLNPETAEDGDLWVKPHDGSEPEVERLRRLD